MKKSPRCLTGRGYAATSLIDLVNVTGLTKGSIYGNFKNKDEVALAAFQHNVGFIIKIIRDKIDRAETAVDKLLAYPQAYRSIAQSVLANGGCPVLNTSVDSTAINSILHEAVCKIIQGWRKSITAIIEQGIQDKELSAEVNAESTAEVLICLVEGGFAMAKTTGEMSYLQNSIDQVERIIRAL